ncbi:efflux RND transporter periplasmic adaptor subunit [Staphylococcus warneri]|uniref:HlyD family efflux transporter periplasmic adaptor subunit n=2 Tax=Staphylococcus warneri TaxID=1292 RepID=A0A2T4Q0E0_STAWA|nr:efflux RND transporter periplasmic adaptor subunit [Staphylococcus warneri]PTI16855.1 hypothetical protein BU084_09135 [Staphylococcus warneri]PTI26395.1 hypothetical protein BU080_00005 [Staphylococcus warneri]PTI51072.1 hypothetical protein BU085_06315 [Staphylococcus warneri]RIN08474.1 efflux RND transporter periplasmic adaptor subunit [Staphylococcus warneri]
MNLNKTIIFSLILLLTIISSGFGFYLYRSSHSPDQLDQVKTIKTKHETLLSTIGTQEAVETFTLYYDKQYGYIHRLFVKLHTYVKKNSPLLEYFNPSKATQLDDQQQLTLKQIQHNFPKLSSSQQQQLTERTLHQSQFLKDKSEVYTQTYTPISGYIHMLNKSPSKNNQPIMQINSKERIIRATISESEKDLLKINQNISIYSNDKNRFIGKVKYISNIPKQINKQTSMYQIEISTQPHYDIGTHFKVRLYSDHIRIPKSALVESKYVLVKLKNKIVKREIKYNTAKQYGYINVTQGLMLNENVVSTPSASLKKVYK